MSEPTVSRYRVVGPRGEGPYVVEAETGLQAAANLGLGRYSLDQPRGPHGPVVAYEYVPSANASAKVGAFDITWLPPASWEDHPLKRP